MEREKTALRRGRRAGRLAQMMPVLDSAVLHIAALTLSPEVTFPVSI
jgi:hypothetical protein